LKRNKKKVKKKVKKKEDVQRAMVSSEVGIGQIWCDEMRYANTDLVKLELIGYC